MYLVASDVSVELIFDSSLASSGGGGSLSIGLWGFLLIGITNLWLGDGDSLLPCLWDDLRGNG